ncbi:MAG: MATE family efflux transporter, partial [Pseudomonadales bacterium]
DTQVTAIGILRGYKDTRVPMTYALIGYWLIGLPIALLFGYGMLGFPDLGIYGFWCGLTAGLAFVAVTTNLRRTRLARSIARIDALASR